MTLKEVQESSKDNISLQKEILLWVKDTEEGKQIIDNQIKLEVDKAISETTSKIYSSIDNDLFQILGTRKQADQKTYDYFKEVASELKELKANGVNNDKVKELEAIIEKQKSEGVSNEHYKKLFNESQAKWEADSKDLKEKLILKDKEFLASKVEADLSVGMAKIKIKKNIPKEAVDAMVMVHKDELIKNAKLVDGKVVYHDNNGSPITNKEFKQITSSELWSEKLGNLIDNNTTGGGGAPVSETKTGSIISVATGDVTKKKLVMDKDSFSTKIEFNNKVEKLLLKQGISIGSKEFNEIADQAYKDYNVSKLNLE